MGCETDADGVAARGAGLMTVAILSAAIQNPFSFLPSEWGRVRIVGRWLRPDASQ
jgi:hypothetical protein